MARVLFIFLLLTGSALAQSNEVNEQALALQLGGFPLLDPDGLLSSDGKQSLESRRVAMRDCCNVDLVLVVQSDSRTGTVENDLALLRGQMVQANLWTPHTLLLIKQSSPPRVVVAQGQAVSMAGLTAETLTDLANNSALNTALPSFFATIENATKAQIVEDQAPLLSPKQYAAIRHLAWTGAVALAALILLLGYRRSSGFSLAQRNLHLMPASPFMSFAFPSKSLKEQAGTLEGAHLVLLQPRQGARHRGLALLIAISANLAAWFWLEVPGLHPSLVGLVSGTLCLLILLTTPLGAWITPLPWRHHAHRVALVRRVLQRDEPCLLMVHQLGRLSLWQPGNLALRPALLTVPAQRLAEEAVHGVPSAGLKTFIDQYVRLYRTYIDSKT